MTSIEERKERLTIKRNGWTKCNRYLISFMNMSTTMDQVVKRAKDSFGPMFDKNLHDLVRGIRNHKDNEVTSLLFLLPTEFLRFSRVNIFKKQSMKSNKNLKMIVLPSKLMQ